MRHILAGTRPSSLFEDDELSPRCEAVPRYRFRAVLFSFLRGFLEPDFFEVETSFALFVFESEDPSIESDLVLTVKRPVLAAVSSHYRGQVADESRSGGAVAHNLVSCHSGSSLDLHLLELL